jgi:hypothetical protein
VFFKIIRVPCRSLLDIDMKILLHIAVGKVTLIFSQIEINGIPDYTQFLKIEIV